MEKRLNEISWISLWRIFLFVLIVAVFYEGRQIILGLFLAIVISSGLESIVNAFERIGLPRSISVILIFLFLALLVIFLIYSIAPLIIVELNTIFAGAGKATSGTFGALLNLPASQSLTETISKISTDFFSGNASPLGLFSSAIGSVGLAVAVILSSFYLCLEKDGVERFIKIVIPPSYESGALDLYERSQKLISSWFRTQLLMSLIMGCTVWVGLALLGVKYAILIAFLAAIFELVPFIGPFLSGAVAVVSALSTSTTLGVYTFIFFVCAQQFESNILVPLITRRVVGLHPVIVIVALLIGAEAGGFLGIVIAVPLAAIFQEVIEQWSIKKRLQPVPTE